jgi:DNA polymerase
MSKLYAIDFETHYTKDYSITELGVDAYIRHPDFDPYLVAIYGEDIKWVGNPRDFDWSRIQGADLVAHNARFDETVFMRCQELNIIPVTFKTGNWYCSADMSVYLSAPRNLAGAAHALLGIDVDKSTRDMLGKISYQEACKKGLKNKVHEYALNDAQLCYALFTMHGGKWPELERGISKLNRESSRRGVHIDVPKLDKYLQDLQTVRWEAAKLIPWEWEDGKTPLSAKSLRLHCRQVGIRCPESLAKDDPDCIAWEDEFGQKYPWVGAMRDWRRSNIMFLRLQTIKERLLPDGSFPYTIKYFGAHTGRFAGDGGFNMQNMPRGENMGVDLRSLFLPRPGKKMVVADLAQIEARITLYLAGDTATLKEIAKGISVYEAHAIRTMGWDRSKGDLKKVDPEFYRLAKARVLGLGFGCGHIKFKELAKMMCDLDITPEQAKQAVMDFRQTNPLITRLWNKLHRDYTWSRGGNYQMELPSGRTITYHDVRTDRDGTTAVTEIGSPRRTHFFGGKLMENAVQATARDVFVEGMDRLARKGIPNLFHAHDEYVTEVDKDFDKEDIRQEIIKAPEWLEGCPLDAEVMEVECYTK